MPSSATTTTTTTPLVVAQYSQTAPPSKPKPDRNCGFRKTFSGLLCSTQPRGLSTVSNRTGYNKEKCVFQGQPVEESPGNKTVSSGLSHHKYDGSSKVRNVEEFSANNFLSLSEQNIPAAVTTQNEQEDISKPALQPGKNVNKMPETEDLTAGSEQLSAARSSEKPIKNNDSIPEAFALSVLSPERREKKPNHETNTTKIDEFNWSSLPFELKSHIIRYCDLASIIKLQKNFHIYDDLYLEEFLSGRVKNINYLNESERSSLYKNTKQVFANCASQRNPFQHYLNRASLADKSALFCALVDEKRLPSPSCNKTIITKSAPNGCSWDATLLSNHRVAISYGNGNTLIWNIDETDDHRPISLPLYDNHDEFISSDNNKPAKSIRLLSKNRLIVTSAVKSRIWDLKETTPTIIKDFSILSDSYLINITEESLVTCNNGVIVQYDLKEGSEGKQLTTKTVNVFPAFLNRENWEEFEKESLQKLITAIKTAFPCSDNQAKEIIINNKNKFTINKIVLLENEHIAILKKLNTYHISVDLNKKSRHPDSIQYLEIYRLTDAPSEPIYTDTLSSLRNTKIFSLIQTGHIAATIDNEIYLLNYQRPSASPHILQGHRDVYELTELDNGLLASRSSSEIMIWNLSRPNYPCIATLKNQDHLLLNIFPLSNGLVCTPTRDNDGLSIWDLSDQKPANSPNNDTLIPTKNLRVDIKDLPSVPKALTSRQIVESVSRGTRLQTRKRKAEWVNGPVSSRTRGKTQKHNELPLMSTLSRKDRIHPQKKPKQAEASMERSPIAFLELPPNSYSNSTYSAFYDNGTIILFDGCNGWLYSTIITVDLFSPPISRVKERRVTVQPQGALSE